MKKPFVASRLLTWPIPAARSSKKRALTAAADGDATLVSGGTANLAVLVGNLPPSTAAFHFPGRDAFHRVPNQLGTTWKSSLLAQRQGECIGSAGSPLHTAAPHHPAARTE